MDIITTRRGWLETFFLAIALILAFALQTTDAHAADSRCQGSPKSHDFIYRDFASANPNNNSGKWVQEWCDASGNFQQRDLYPAVRTETGPGATKFFDAGNIVWASKIVYNDGTTFENCMTATSQWGQATNGVVNPTIAEELANRPRQCGAPQQAQPNQPQVDNTRVASGNGGRLDFVRGQSVMGAYIKLNSGTERNQCSYDSAPDNGFLLSGIRGTPYPGEKLPPCA